MIVRVNALHDAGDAFQAPCRVDVLGRQRFKVVWRIADAVELREDEVPDLDLLAVADVVVDFAARAADAVGAFARRFGRPEVFVFAAAC